MVDAGPVGGEEREDQVDRLAVYGIEVDVVAGPATDNAVGVRFVERLGVPARNAKVDGPALGQLALDKVRAKLG